MDDGQPQAVSRFYELPGALAEVHQIGMQKDRRGPTLEGLYRTYGPDKHVRCIDALQHQP